MARLRQKLLLVEGKEDQYAIAELMAKHVPWGKTEREWPVYIQPLGGVTQLLNEVIIGTYLKSSEAAICGIVLDANESFHVRWQQLRRCCEREFPSIPDDLPKEGLVLDNSSGRRLGVWIMPDNSSRGMLETFLTYLVRDQSDQLWLHACASADGATGKGAPYKRAHVDKARMHTWLAWQDPPGLPLGLAILQNVLSAEATGAGPFVRWFRSLFKLSPSASAPPDLASD